MIRFCSCALMVPVVVMELCLRKKIDEWVMGAVPARTLGQCPPDWRWIVRSHVGWREGNKTFIIRVWKPLFNRRVLKPMKLMAIRNEPKQTISASGGLGP